jgi:hypothetical protein
MDALRIFGKDKFKFISLDRTQELTGKWKGQTEVDGS